ncbi:hypothetical protein [Arthrobacter bambusae]|uniref:hypothetical protein n=1 Tax=Arthrobacter bambusae TaxID=1338426 RepID=UPI00277E239E|nr:hypothetical protein [Arthrobacter bambusae]MDQ0032002.1 hypothetical protein [Arthrobacter bambusae]MDQ0100142.1 hypothetical protein [Arthrobacter bambusae]
MFADGETAVHSPGAARRLPVENVGAGRGLRAGTQPSARTHDAAEAPYDMHMAPFTVTRNALVPAAPEGDGTRVTTRKNP